MNTENKNIASLLSELREMFDDEAESALHGWNCLDSDDPNVPYHRGKMDQTVYLHKRVDKILSDVIIAHLDPSNEKLSDSHHE